METPHNRSCGLRRIFCPIMGCCPIKTFQIPEGGATVTFCDLHTHSTASDGTFSPKELVEKARNIGLGAVALTDHNTLAGLSEFVQAAQGTTVRPIPGIEVSTEYEGHEVHIVGLFLTPKTGPELAEHLKVFEQEKEENNRELVDALNRAGYRISWEQLRHQVMGRMNRAHIAAALTEAGYIHSPEEAFRTILRPDGEFYHPPHCPQSLPVLEMLRDLKICPVLAHPFLSLMPRQLAQFLPEAKKRGLMGMEVFYSTYDSRTTQTAQAMAEHYGLLPSGGSDFHGTIKPDIGLGVGRGNLQIPMQWLERLEEAAETM